MSWCIKGCEAVKLLVWVEKVPRRASACDKRGELEKHQKVENRSEGELYQKLESRPVR